MGRESRRDKPAAEVLATNLHVKTGFRLTRLGAGILQYPKSSRVLLWLTLYPLTITTHAARGCWAGIVDGYQQAKKDHDYVRALLESRDDVSALRK